MESVVYQTLEKTLSPVANERVPAEVELKRFEQQQPEYCLALASIAAAQECALELRQTALVVLKGYVNRHWNLAVESYEEGPIPSPDVSLRWVSWATITMGARLVKAAVRERVFGLLSSDEPKLRLAAVVSNIAKYDWPDEWPGLFDALLLLLRQGSPKQVHAAIRVYAEWIRPNMTDAHVSHLLGLLGELRRLVVSPE
ncbi:hypothetical protein EV182_006815, partial [Spiromyces aspiralis]